MNDRQTALAWFERYTPLSLWLTHRWIRAKLIHPQNSEGLYQAALIALWDVAQKVDTRAPEKKQIGYLHQVILHRLCTHMRRDDGVVHMGRHTTPQSRCVRFSDLLADATVDDLGCVPTVEPAELDDSRDAVLCLARDLPPDQQQLLLWYHVDGLSLEQVGHRIGRGRSRAHQHLQAIHEDLRIQWRNCANALKAIGAA